LILYLRRQTVLIQSCHYSLRSTNQYTVVNCQWLVPIKYRTSQKYTSNKTIKNIIRLTVAYLSFSFMGLRQTAVQNVPVFLTAHCQTTKGGRIQKKSVTFPRFKTSCKIFPEIRPVHCASSAP
jgi:hypothetical protein